MNDVGRSSVGPHRSSHRGWRRLAVCLALTAGCTGLSEEPTTPARLPAPRRHASPAAAALMDKGRSLFDSEKYELATAAFEAATTDPEAAIEARAFLGRIEVLMGQAPPDGWVVDPARASEPVMAARLTVETRLLINDARRLLAQGRSEEALLRLERARVLIEAVSPTENR